jgi:hypothetical protein
MIYYGTMMELLGDWRSDSALVAWGWLQGGAVAGARRFENG